jgi:dCMP deaminase
VRAPTPRPDAERLAGTEPNGTEIHEGAAVGYRSSPGRLSRDEYFMTIAWAASRRSTCRRRSVGAVVVDQRGRILSTGYNGSPEGYPHCEELCGPVVDAPCRWSVHAEINALLFADNREADKTLYVTTSPCQQCALAIANAGVARVVVGEPYRTDEGLEVLRLGGIPYVFLAVDAARHPTP